MSGRHRNSSWSSAYHSATHELGLPAPTCVESGDLRHWVPGQSEQVLLHPKWLLKTWGISVNSDVLCGA